MEKIDWEDLRLGYNRIKKTDFKTEKEFLEGVLDIHIYEEASIVLGVSADTIGRKRRKLRNKGINLIISKKTIRERFQRISPNRMKKMTKLEIAEELNCADKYVGMLASEFNRKFIKVLNAGVYYANQKRCNLI